MSKVVLKIYRRSRRNEGSPPDQVDASLGDSEHDAPLPSDFGKESPELRSASREDHVHKVRYKVLIPMEGEGFTQDASRDGFRVFLDKEVPPGAVMEMKFRELNSSDTEKPHPIGKVVWRKDHMAGVKVLRK